MGGSVAWNCGKSIKLCGRELSQGLNLNVEGRIIDLKLTPEQGYHMQTKVWLYTEASTTEVAGLLVVDHVAAQLYSDPYGPALEIAKAGVQGLDGFGSDVVDEAHATALRLQEELTRGDRDNWEDYVEVLEVLDALYSDDNREYWDVGWHQVQVPYDNVLYVNYRASALEAPVAWVHTSLSEAIQAVLDNLNSEIRGQSLEDEYLGLDDIGRLVADEDVRRVDALLDQFHSGQDEVILGYGPRLVLSSDVWLPQLTPVRQAINVLKRWCSFGVGDWEPTPASGFFIPNRSGEMFGVHRMFGYAACPTELPLGEEFFQWIAANIPDADIVFPKFPLHQFAPLSDDTLSITWPQTPIGARLDVLFGRRVDPEEWQPRPPLLPWIPA